MYTRSLQDRIW